MENIYLSELYYISFLFQAQYFFPYALTLYEASG